MTHLDKVKESTIVRGIAATINAMKFPTLENLMDLIKQNFNS